jgi:transcriptional regulator with XRE-family HTH domain
MSRRQPIDPTVGATIRRIREEKGISMNALAKAADTTAAVVLRLERGERSTSFEVVRRLCAALGVSLAVLDLPEQKEP